MNIWAATIKDRRYEFEVGEPEFDFAYDGLKYPKLCLFITRRTQFPNIIWMKIITFGLHWPPMRTTAAFTSLDEAFEEIR